MKKGFCIQQKAICGQQTAVLLLTALCLLPALLFSQWLETTIPVGENPEALCWNSVDNKVYCTHRVNDSVTIIDGVTNQVITTVKAGSHPCALAYNLSNNKVYCANWLSNNVTVINGATNQIDTTIPVDDWPSILLWNPKDNKVYCANCGSFNISVIDGSTNQVDTTISTRFWPLALALNTTDNRIYCGIEAVNEVMVIDGFNQQVIARIRVGEMPFDVIWNSISNKVYSANQISNDVTIIDGATNQVIKNIRVGGSPNILVYNSTNNKVYCVGSDGLCVIDGVGNSIITVVPGISSDALIYNLINNKIYSADYWSNDVTVIDGTGDTIIMTLGVGNGPIAFTWNPVQNRIYVANKNGSSISVIRDEIPGIEERTMLDAGRLAPEIYPNPAKTVIRVRYPRSDKGSRLIQAIKIFDVSGKLIREIASPPKADRNDERIEISLKGINPGIYFLQLGTVESTLGRVERPDLWREDPTREVKKFLVVK
ncbi:MAG: T9SS type A sorting domain-containing protein [candidate division WOR-3 bacterium]|nr:T9SS type A sorting domain-containing protein [candidate division WOR-3 bacterium]MDH5684116.1 T9SS type A sorting domain-containing protein [candidate division WOR-3 bacterium]